MSWTNRVLVTLDEHKWKDEVRHRWEIVRPENGEGKHFEAELCKIGYYKKDGVLTRGYPKGLQARDLKWLDDNRAAIDKALAAKYDAIGAVPPAVEPAPPAYTDDGGVEEVPF